METSKYDTLINLSEDVRELLLQEANKNSEFPSLRR